MTGALKLGLYGLHRGGTSDPEGLAKRARMAEEVGFESLWVGDHIALPSDMDGEQPRLEAVVAVTYLAAVTTRIRLAFGVLVLPQRQPVLLAKQVASIDNLSRGRLILGIGVGYVEPELRALGVPLGERAARTDEYLAAMRTLWREEPPTFDGRFVGFADVWQRPRPVQLPHPPIVISGHSPAAHRRAVRTGRGWYGWRLDVEQAAEALAELREAAKHTERPDELGQLEITITPPGPVDLDTARRYADIGVHRLTLEPASADGPAVDELIARVGDTLIGRV